jgi:lipase chaperone LimK
VRVTILLLGGDKRDRWTAWYEQATPKRTGCGTSIWLNRETRRTVMSPKAKKFSDLAAPVYADPDRRERIETEKRAILTGLRLAAELRAEQGLTQVQLARRLGTTQENVSRIERAEETQLSTIKRYVPRLGP